MAEREKDPDLRRLRLESARRYIDADIEVNMKNKSDNSFRDVHTLLLCYVVIFASALITFKWLGFFAAVATVIGSFALLSLMMGVFLRLRGELSESNLLKMIQEGFKALFLLRKTDGESKKLTSDKG